MATIGEFNVVEPPTSAEVQERARQVLGKSSTVHLVLLSTQEVPRPVAKEVDVKISATTLPDDGGMVIKGYDSSESGTIVVTTQPDGTQPATATWVIPDATSNGPMLAKPA